MHNMVTNLLGIQNTDYRVLFEGMNMQRLFGGLYVTAKIAFISVIIACILGVLFGIVMTFKSKIVHAICRLYLEIVRIIPILVWLFILYFGVDKAFNLNVRGAITSIPKHQEEAAISLNLNRKDIYLYVILPQALKRILPGAINLSTRMIKTTSLVVLIGVVEVVKIGQQIIETSILKAPTASFWVYGFIFFLYFIICYPLSKISKILEQKWVG